MEKTVVREHVTGSVERKNSDSYKVAIEQVCKLGQGEFKSITF